MRARSGHHPAGGAKPARRTGRRLGPGIAATALALVLGGCVSRGEVDRFSTVRDVSPREAFVMPPAGGPAIVGVLEQRYSNGLEQEIVLAGGGAVAAPNAMRIQFIGPVDSSTSGRTPLSERSLAFTDIARELRAEFPGVAMARSPLYVQNRYGPFGYATGRSGATTCLYAWQRMTGTDHATLLLRPRGTINLRLRRCEAGASEAQLLSTMYGLGINAFLNHFSWMPYGDPPPPSAALGETGAPIYPVAPTAAPAVFVEPVPEDAPPPSRAPRRTRPAAPAPAPAAPAPAEPLPAPIGLPVPLPPAPGTVPPDAATPETGTAQPAVPMRPPVAPPSICADGSLMTNGGC